MALSRAFPVHFLALSLSVGLDCPKVCEDVVPVLVSIEGEVNPVDDAFEDDAGQVTVTYDIRNPDDDTVGIGDVTLLVFTEDAT